MAALARFCERLFAKCLDGNALMNNATHLRGSAIWIRFPRVVCQRWVHHETINGKRVPIVLMGTHVDCTVNPCYPNAPGRGPQVYTTAWDTALSALATKYHAGLLLDVEKGLLPADKTDWLHCTASGYQKIADRVEVALRARLAAG